MKTLMKTGFLLFVFIFLSCATLKGQDSLSNKLIDGKTEKQIVNEYIYWSKIKNDLANLVRYQEANKMLKPPTENKKRVVFMGNSITEMWKVHSPEFFKNKGYINRGISGQTSSQMLLRFRQDVIDLNPKIVVILAGTNDIAGNTGPTTNAMILNNIISMVDLATANNSQVILCSILPVNKYPWFPHLQPAQRVISLNTALKSYALKNKIPYVDFFSHLVDKKNGLPLKYASDGVHPNKVGYSIMEPLLENYIRPILQK